MRFPRLLTAILITTGLATAASAQTPTEKPQLSQLSKEQRQALHKQAIEHFSEMDTNGDGAVSKDEYLAHAAATFAKLDKNGDGKLDKADHPKPGAPATETKPQ